MLAAVLFTDIVGSTERLINLGDAEWRSIVSRHLERARSEIRATKAVSGLRRRRGLRDLRRPRARGPVCSGDQRVGPGPQPSRYAQACTRATWNLTVRLSAASPFASAQGWQRWVVLPKSSSRRR